MTSTQVKELLLQSLEHEKCSVLVYQMALECAVNDELAREWEQYLLETENHLTVLTGACKSVGVDPGHRTPGCQIVHHLGKTLVQAMKTALTTSNPAAAELVACECVVLAETGIHLNWKLIGACAREMTGEPAKTLRAAYREVQNEVDEHLYHSAGWARELWLESLGLQAILPPPEKREVGESDFEAEEARKAMRSWRRESDASRPASQSARISRHES